MKKVISVNDVGRWDWNMKCSSLPNTLFMGNPINTYNTKLIYGSNTANYAKIKAEGKILPFNFYWNFQSSGTLVYSHRFADNGSGLTCDHVNFGGFFDPVKPDWFLENSEDMQYLIDQTKRQRALLVQKAAAKAFLTGYDILTAIGESESTLALFKGIGLRLVRYIRRLQWEKLWLEARYGWRPLYNDLLNLNAAIAKERAGQTAFTRAKEVAISKEDKQSLKRTRITDPDGFIIDVLYEDIRSLSLKGSVVADFEARDNFDITPISSLWELTTFSFVVDWFLSVGDALGATQLLATAKEIRAGSSIRLSVARRFYTVTLQQPTVGSITQSCEGFCNLEFKYRSPDTVQVLPFYQAKLDPYKIVDLVALVRTTWQARRKRGR